MLTFRRPISTQSIHYSNPQQAQLLGPLAYHHPLPLKYNTKRSCDGTHLVTTVWAPPVKLTKRSRSVTTAVIPAFPFALGCLLVEHGIVVLGEVSDLGSKRGRAPLKEEGE